MFEMIRTCGVFTAAAWCPVALAAQTIPAGVGRPAADCAAPAPTTDHTMMDHAAHAEIMATCGSLAKLPGQAALGTGGIPLLQHNY